MNVNFQFISVKFWVLFLYCALPIGGELAVAMPDGSEDEKKRPSMPAYRTTTAPKIDGELNDDMWKNAPIADNFITFEPYVGHAPDNKTEVRIMYDNIAMYIFAYMYDAAPDSILRQFSARDNEDSAADRISIVLDTYKDGQNSFNFTVTAAGVQTDVRQSSQNTDVSWNAVWESKVKIQPDGWSAELKIPYSALRFPVKSVQEWGLNIIRDNRRRRERSSWSAIDPSEQGMVQQCGALCGIQDIKPPLRLSITPYAAFYVENYHDGEHPEDNYSTQTFRGGMDIKYGINESFTLDMILIPDFGQVKYDNQVLNLSPYEIRFDENRPFFMEGTELFNKGGVFYSRRIGGRPIGYWDAQSNLADNEVLTNNPATVQLYNATKLSGRTQKKLGVGFFNAVTGPTTATVVNNVSGEKRDIETAPLTNYNLIVFDQLLKNRSYVSLTNTNVWRSGHWRDANVTALSSRINGPKNKFGLQADAALSQVLEGGKNQIGFRSFIDYGKQSGTMTYGIIQNIESDQYNPNDLGFLLNPNEFSHYAYIGYNNYKGFGKISRFFAGATLSYSRLYKPMKFQYAGLETYLTFIQASGMAFGGNFNYRPKGNDFFEPRREGRFSVVSQYFSTNMWVSTPYNKPFAVDANAGLSIDPLYDSRSYWVGTSARIRATNRLFFVLGSSLEQIPLTTGYTTTDSNTNDIIYGKRTQNTINNDVYVQYMFGPKMGITLRTRHYWAKVLYNSYHILQEDGYLSPQATNTDYQRNVSFNAFNLDLGYTWQFAPGSELSIFWRDAIYYLINSDNNHFNTIEKDNYIDNLRYALNAPQTNSFSMRVLYYLDYQTVSKRRYKQ